jgi:hypothetical protein
MDKFKTATKIAYSIANYYSTSDIKNELYQLFILHYGYNKAVKLSNEVEPKNYESELRSLIVLLSVNEIKYMDNNLKSI